jgi:hypothetical protein
MVSQDTPRKILRIDDVTEGDEANGAAPSSQSFAVPPQRPTTRSSVSSQAPGARVTGPVPPEQKFAASYQRAKEISEQTRIEMMEINKMQQVANSNPIPPVMPIPEAPAVEMPKTQSTEYLQSDLSLLALAGRIEEEAVIGGFKFKITTLTSGEQDDVVAAVSTIAGDDLVKLGQLRLQLLARAIRTVNGVPLEHLYRGNEQIANIEKRILFLKSLQLALTIKLFDVYSNLLDRSEKVFEIVSGKNDLLKN